MDVARSVTVAVVIGGGPIRPPCGAGRRPFDAVIAADSGLDVALAAGLEPTLLVGDLDSVSADGLRWAAERGVGVERHPSDKDDTDTALALGRAVAIGATEVVLFGTDITFRLDHLLGTLSCLGAPVLRELDRVTAHLGGTTVHVLHAGRRTTLQLDAGRVFSLLALHGECRGVCVDSAHWTLIDGSLPAGSSLGISNESLGSPITVSVAAGVLTVIVPEVVS